MITTFRRRAGGSTSGNALIEEAPRASPSREDERRRYYRLTATGLTLVKAEAIWLHLKFAVRLLRRHPACTVATLLTLTLAVGLNTAVFSAVHAVLLEPLPYPDAERLVRIWERKGATPGSLRRQVLVQGALLVGVGLVAGAAGAYAVTRIAARSLDDVTAADPMVFLIAMALVASTSLLAADIPARRATRVDPAGILRH